VSNIAKSGAREVCVFAESQTRGRGDAAGVESPRGRIVVFSVLRPTLPPSAASRITVAASVAVARALRQNCGVDARINAERRDVNGKKLAGILLRLNYLRRRDTAL